MDTEASDLCASNAAVEREQEELETVVGRGESGIGGAAVGNEGFRRTGCGGSARPDGAGEGRIEETGLGHGLVGDERSILRESHKVRPECNC